MSVKGLQQSEKISNSLSLRIKQMLNKQRKELRSEISKLEFLLLDRDKLIEWCNNSTAKQKVEKILADLSEVERLYLVAGDSRSAKIFKERINNQLSTKLTNLKANQLEVEIKSKQYQLQSKKDILKTLNEIDKEARLTELYNQARQSGGFLANFGRTYSGDLITLETKAAGSKTLGKYMNNLFRAYENGLKDVFVKGLVRGDSYAQMVSNLQKTVKTTAGKADLLITTEANAIFNQSVLDVIDDNPLVKGFTYRAVLDGRTSKICQEHDGKYIPKEQVKPGINYPPLHPRCRSTVTTVLMTDDERKDTVQRYTKNGSNQWIKVPLGMTYKEFKGAYQDLGGQK